MGCIEVTRDCIKVLNKWTASNTFDLGSKEKVRLLLLDFEQIGPR